MSADEFDAVTASTDGDAAAIIQAAREHANPVKVDPKVDERHVFVVPDGSTVEVVEPDDTRLDAPRRLTGAVRVDDVASFTAYVAEFYFADTTTAWVDPKGLRVTALLDDASGEHGAAWRDHRAVLGMQRTPEWARWLSLNAKMVDQERFARHIEMSELDIANPDGATLLEIAQSFYATTTAEFGSSQRLDSGEVQFNYTETIAAKAGRKREVTIPKKFELRIAPFVGEDPVVVTALLRYRSQGGSLTLGYELVRPEDIERAVMDAVAEKLRGSIARVYIGAPAEAGA